MGPALLLVDLQRDFLLREGLSPPAVELVGRVATLLNGCRELGIPVIHVRTLVRPDGTDRMPHWIRTGRWACVEGTAGAEPPAELSPGPSEWALRKRFFSAFGSRELAGILEAGGVDTLVIAGVYLHGCVRATVLDAYERGYDVWVAADAVGSTDAMHARVSREWLDGRAAAFMDTGALLRRLRDAQADRGIKRATAR